MFRFGGFEATVDAYRIDIDNRIVLSENLNTPQVAALIAPFGATVARFFINGVDTKTEGIDLVARYLWRTENVGRFEFIAAGNWNDTEVEKVPSTNVIDNICNGQPAPCTPPVLFARINTLSFEEGTPDNKMSLGVDWNVPLGAADFGVNLKGTRYGEVDRAGRADRQPRSPPESRMRAICTSSRTGSSISPSTPNCMDKKLGLTIGVGQHVRPVSGPRTERARDPDATRWSRESECHQRARIFALFTVRLQRAVSISHACPSTGKRHRAGAACRRRPRHLTHII